MQLGTLKKIAKTVFRNSLNQNILNRRKHLFYASFEARLFKEISIPKYIAFLSFSLHFDDYCVLKDMMHAKGDHWNVNIII